MSDPDYLISPWRQLQQQQGSMVNSKPKASLPTKFNQVKNDKPGLDGIDEKRITNAPEQQKNIKRVTCSICHKVLWKPVCCSGCENSFCKYCMDQWSQKSKECPNRCVFKEKKVPPIIKDILSDFQVTCFYRGNGCGDNLSYDNLEKHQNECGFVASECKGCKKLLCKNVLEGHEKDCPLVMVKCGNCEATRTRAEMQSHTEVACLQLQVKSMKETIKLLVSKVDVLEKKNSSVNPYPYVPYEMVKPYQY